MTTGQAGQTPDGDGPASTTLLVAVVTAVLAFFLQGVAAFLALLVLGCALVLLIRRRRHRDRRGLAIGAAVLAVVALVIAGATGDEPAPPPAPVVAAPPADPNALPGRVVVVSVNAPDDLVTDTGRRLYVPMLRWYRGPDSCRVAAGRAATSELVSGKPVTVAVAGPGRVDPAVALPPGAQAVTLTLPDGRDYVTAWTALAPRTSRSACSPRTTTPPTTTTTTTEEAVPTTVDEQPDIDRRYVPDVPEPRTKARSGQSGHPCLPGERDGDGDGYCGE